jgi:membrane protein
LEFDAGTLRRRAIAGGLHPHDQAYAPPRDTRTWDQDDVERRGLA